MRPTFLGFETCKRGIAVNQKVMDIVGQNITNKDTPGYTRQRVDLISVSPSYYATRYGTLRTGLAGQGVDMNGISQVRDPYLDKRFREEYGDASYAGQAAGILSDIQSALREDGQSSNAAMQGAIQQMVDALNNKANNSSDESIANLFAVSAKNMSQVLRELNSKLDNVADQQKFDMEISVESYNDYARKIADLNVAIRDDVLAHAPSEYYGPNELMDQRNLLIDELAQFGDMDVANNKDGTVTIQMNGHTVVSGDTADELVMTRKNNGTVSLCWNSTGGDFNATTGTLKAYTDFINGRGPNMSDKGETIECGIPYYRDKLDSYAASLTNVFNSLVPKDDDGDGAPDVDGGGNVQYKTLFGARVPETDPLTGAAIPGKYKTTVDVPVTAANISISGDWEKDSSFVMFEKGSLKNVDSVQLIAMLEGDQGSVSFTANNEKFTGSFREFVNDYATKLGTDTSYYLGRSKSTALIADDMLDRRDEVSAVSQDEETQTMMMYNKSFQAISRVLTTMDEALDVLINRTGMVGR